MNQSEINMIILNGKIQELAEGYREYGIVFQHISVSEYGYNVEFYHPSHDKKKQIGDLIEYDYNFCVSNWYGSDVTKHDIKTSMKHIGRHLEKKKNQYIEKFLQED